MSVNFRPLAIRLSYLFFGTFMLLCSLVLLSFSSSVHADSYTVTATVPAPLPTQPAIITYPADQQHLTTSNTRVEGTCSSDTAYVEIYRNGVLAGTTPCVGGAFTLFITLVLGANSLQARAFSSTGGEGPSAPPITVYYDIINPSVPPGAPPKQDDIVSTFLRLIGLAPNRQQTVPFFITAKQPYIAYKPGQQLSWPTTAHGGISPYTITVKWGDHITTTEEFREATFNLEHTYNNPGYYRVEIHATDSEGNKAYLQLIAIVKGDPIHASGDTTTFSWQSIDWIALMAIALAILAALLLALHRQAIMSLFPFFFGDKLKKRRGSKSNKP